MSTTLAAGYGVPGSPVLVSPGERLCHGGSAVAGSRGSVGICPLFLLDNKLGAKQIITGSSDQIIGLSIPPWKRFCCLVKAPPIPHL